MVIISWTKLLAGALALTAAVAGATFAVSRLATESYVNALQLQVVQLDRRVHELQAELGSRRQPPGETTGSSEPLPRPDDSREQRLSISFSQPRNGAQVSQFIDVEYAIADTVPTGYRAILLVRDPLGQYWSWGTSTSGLHVRVQIGVAEDSGRQFEIGVLVTDREVPFGQPRRSLPEGIAYESISVTRR